MLFNIVFLSFRVFTVSLNFPHRPKMEFECKRILNKNNNSITLK